MTTRNTNFVILCILLLFLSTPSHYQTDSELSNRIKIDETPPQLRSIPFPISDYSINDSLDQGEYIAFTPDLIYLDRNNNGINDSIQFDVNFEYSLNTSKWKLSYVVESYYGGNLIATEYAESVSFSNPARIRTKVFSVGEGNYTSKIVLFVNNLVGGYFTENFNFTEDLTGNGYWESGDIGTSTTQFWNNFDINIGYSFKHQTNVTYMGVVEDTGTPISKFNKSKIYNMQKYVTDEQFELPVILPVGTYQVQLTILFNGTQYKSMTIDFTVYSESYAGIKDLGSGQYAVWKNEINTYDWGNTPGTDLFAFKSKFDLAALGTYNFTFLFDFSFYNQSTTSYESIDTQRLNATVVRDTTDRSSTRSLDLTGLRFTEYTAGYRIDAKVYLNDVLVDTQQLDFPSMVAYNQSQNKLASVLSYTDAAKSLDSDGLKEMLYLSQVIFANATGITDLRHEVSFYSNTTGLLVYESIFHTNFQGVYNHMAINDFIPNHLGLYDITSKLYLNNSLIHFRHDQEQIDLNGEEYYPLLRLEPRLPDVYEAGGDVLVNFTLGNEGMNISGNYRIIVDGNVKSGLEGPITNPESKTVHVPDLPVGQHVIGVNYYDQYGWNYTRNMVVTIIDTKAPELDIEHLTTRINMNESQTLEIALYDASYFNYSLTIGKNYSRNGSFSHNRSLSFDISSLMAPNSYNVTLDTIDEFGNSQHYSFLLELVIVVDTTTTTSQTPQQNTTSVVTPSDDTTATKGFLSFGDLYYAGVIAVFILVPTIVRKRSYIVSD